MYKYFLQGLRVGVISNLFLLWASLTITNISDDLFLVVPAIILISVSAFRCLFPVNYASKAVIIDSVLSSVFVTRFLVTIVEVTYIYMFSYVLRIINSDQYMFVDLISWLMVIQVIISQFFCWGAILLKYERFYFYEEFGWFIIFFINTILSIVMLSLDLSNAHYSLIIISMVFGSLYLPWQVLHLKSITNRINTNPEIKAQEFKMNLSKVKFEFKSSIYDRKVSFDINDWGRVVGMMWMYGYWILFIPVWMFYIILII
jgi:hypothetical protein